MLNVVVLIGRLVRDPELRYTPQGTAVGNFTLAVDRPFTNQDGERDTDFIDIVVWRRLAETCAEHLGKGRLVAVNGRLQIRSYDDRNGIRRKASEIVANDVRFLDSPGSRSSAGTAQAGSGTPEGSQTGGADDDQFNDAFEFDDDDVPF